MQTVSFQCGHCHKVMGVTAAYLGKQVRCPHCQQVVMAPAAPPPAPSPRATPDPTAGFSVPPPQRDEHESIFGEHIDEDLFGGGSHKAMVELPPEQHQPNLQLEPTLFNVPGLPADNGAALSGGGAAVATSRPPSVPSLSSPMPNYSQTEVATSPSAWQGSAPESPAPPSEESRQQPAPVATLPQMNHAGGNPTVLMYLLIVIAPYALFMTGIALYYYYQVQSRPHPLEMLPDDGEPKSSKGQSQSRVINRIVPTTELPPHLRAQLGQTIKLGDLEVTPEKIEAKPIGYKVWGSSTVTPPTNGGDSFVLTLLLKNASRDTSFRPTDSYWERKWEEDDPGRGPMPYTFLWANGHVHGGVLDWQKGRAKLKPGDNLNRELIAGQEDNAKILKPNEAIRTVIATNPDKDLPTTLARYKDKMLWRVQLRRGLERVKGRDVSASGVIGVEFDMSQVTKP